MAGTLFERMAGNPQGDWLINELPVSVGPSPKESGPGEGVK